MSYQTLKELALETYDAGDRFAWCQGWRFAICDALLFDFGKLSNGYRTMANAPDESYEYEMLTGMWSAHLMEDGVSLPVDQFHWEEDMEELLKILDRYREWLRAAGEDY